MTGIAWKIAKPEVWLMTDAMVSHTSGPSGEKCKVFPVLEAHSMMCMVGSLYALADWLQHLVRALTVRS